MYYINYSSFFESYSGRENTGKVWDLQNKTLPYPLNPLHSSRIQKEREAIRTNKRDVNETMLPMR